MWLIGHAFLFLSQLVESSAYRSTQNTRRIRDFYIKEALTFIEANFQRDITIEEIAEVCGLNRSYLTRLFKETTGYSLQEYLGIYRMKIAAKMLAESNLPVQAIASKVGYGDAFTFAKAFKRHTGKSPTEYRSSGGSITVD